MADLIDRAVLGIGKANPLAFVKPEYADGWNSAIEIIQNAPSVDAVEVVRCKDCVYHENGECECPYIFISDGAHIYPDPDDYCSYGRRTDETD